MLKEGRACVITDMEGLRKRAQERRPSSDYIRSLLVSAQKIDKHELRKRLEEK